MATIEFRYRPAGGTLSRFHRHDGFVRILLGPLGSAKTTACCAEVWRRASEQAPDGENIRRSRWLVVRNTYPELITTTIPSWREMFGDRFGKFTWGHPPCHRIDVALDDGTRVVTEVIFLAMDSDEAAKKLLSFEVIVGVTWVDALRGSVRPIVTYVMVAEFVFIKSAAMYLIFGADGVTLETLNEVWDEETRALFAAILSFWFGHRALKYFYPR